MEATTPSPTSTGLAPTANYDGPPAGPPSPPPTESSTAPNKAARRPRNTDRFRKGGNPKGRGRHMTSCAECRRRKLKCDSLVPCSNCVKRECASICPTGTRDMANNNQIDAMSSHEHRIAQLEAALRAQNNTAMTTLPNISVDGTLPGRPRSNGVSERRASESANTAAITAAPAVDETQMSVGQDSIEVAMPDQPAVSHDGFGYLANEPSPPCLRHGSAPGDNTSLRVPPEGISPHSEAPRRMSSPAQDASGTLVVDDVGRSRYFGPRAGAEWLHHQERPGATRHVPDMADAAQHVSPDFPFNPPATILSTWGLFNKLPPREETGVLVEAYFRNFSWNLSPVTRAAFDHVFAKAYKGIRPTSSHGGGPPIHVHELALLYAIFAMGAHHCLEYPPNDPIVEEYMGLAKSCLSHGNFLVTNTIAGLQALSLIGHLSTETECGRRGELAWPLYGLCMRLVQAMGIHRDGAKWSLPRTVVEERRLIFWECYTIDVFQAHCFSRPPSMQANHFDTQLPAEGSVSSPADSYSGSVTQEPSQARRDFKTMKYEIVKVLAGLLDVAMNTTPPPYETVLDQYETICAFERSIPYHLRCRDALTATISRYPTPEAAILDSPPVKRRDLKTTFEQYTLAMHVSEAVLFLQRPYYVQAMEENPLDPVRSRYGASFLAVLERCNVVTHIVGGLTRLHPAVASRHWFFWYHLFNAVACVGALVLRCPPDSAFNPFAMSILDQGIAAYSVVTRQNPSSTLKLNHDRLLLLRRRASKLMKTSTATAAAQNPQQLSQRTTSLPEDGEGGGDEDDVGGDGEVHEKLLGWRTRLIERAAAVAESGDGSGDGVAAAAAAGWGQRATTIVSSSSSNHNNNNNEHNNQQWGNGGGGGGDFDMGGIMSSDLTNSTSPFLSMLYMDSQLPSAELMMNQHFVMNSSDFDAPGAHMDVTGGAGGQGGEAPIGDHHLGQQW